MAAGSENENKAGSSPAPTDRTADSRPTMAQAAIQDFWAQLPAYTTGLIARSRPRLYSIYYLLHGSEESAGPRAKARVLVAAL